MNEHTVRDDIPRYSPDPDNGLFPSRTGHQITILGRVAVFDPMTSMTDAVPMLWARFEDGLTITIWPWEVAASEVHIHQGGTLNAYCGLPLSDEVTFVAWEDAAESDCPGCHRIFGLKS